MEKPTNEEIQKFIKVFDKLCQFEASQRVVRGYGCFNEEELPFTEVVKVTSWLKEKVVSTEKDLIDKLVNKYEKLADSLRIEASSAYSKNDYISYSSLNEEADLYDTVVKDLKNIGGITASGRLKR